MSHLINISLAHIFPKFVVSIFNNLQITRKKPVLPQLLGDSVYDLSHEQTKKMPSIHLFREKWIRFIH